MKIIIVGLGDTGLRLVQDFARERKHQIVVIDTDGTKISEVIGSSSDVNGIVGNGCFAPILEDAGANGADLIIAVTERDELNILCCLVAESLGTKYSIAQVHNAEYYAHYDSMGGHLGVNLFVNQEAVVADEIFRILKAPKGVKLATFGKKKLEMAEFTIDKDSKLVGKSLMQVRNTKKKDFLFVSVSRGEEVIMPNGSTVLEEGDVINVCAKHQELPKVLDYFSIGNDTVRSVIILGSTETAYSLAKNLLENNVRVKLISSDEQACQKLNERLETLTVVCDDCFDEEVLIREGIAFADALVVMTPSDEKNVLVSLYAQRYKLRKLVTVVRSGLYQSVLKENASNVVVSPYSLVVENIAMHGRWVNVPKDSQILSLRRLAHDRVEALEFNVGKNPAFVGKSVAQLSGSIRPGLLFCAIIRNGRVPIIPHGDTVIEAGDNIIVASIDQRLKQLEDILK